jgi:UDP-N-acetylglucosamine 2-epimerase (non-hydrolysing)
MLILPLHPRTKQLLHTHAIDTHGIRIIDPQDYFNFLVLLNNARIVLTDSGGIQEEACLLGIPCITLRDNTERQETLELKSNILVGSDLARTTSAINYFESNHAGWKQPYGLGDTADRILSYL